MHLERVLKLEASVRKTLEFKKSKLRFLKSVRFTLKMSYAGSISPSPAISAHFVVFPTSVYPLTSTLTYSPAACRLAHKRQRGTSRLMTIEEAVATWHSLC